MIASIVMRVVCALRKSHLHEVEYCDSLIKLERCHQISGGKKIFFFDFQNIYY